jgi:hypothetical protein
MNRILLSLLFLPFFSIAQQNLSVMSADSLLITADSARGQLQWQISYDSITWSPIVGQQTLMLQTVADSFPAFIRLEILEGDCDPWYSEVLTLTESSPLQCGDSISHGFVAGFQPSAGVVFAFRTYSTVLANWSGPGGDKCWTKMNIGATAEATSATDASDAAAGWFFQFNRSQGYVNDGTTRTPNTPWINPINENLNWQSSNDPCTQLLGADWRIPTQAEWNAYLNAPTAQGGVGGQTGLLSDAFASTLKIHAGGNLSGGAGDVQNRGNWGVFWSAEQNSNNTAGAFRFSGIGSFPVNATKNFGYPLRCICDCP